MNTKNIQNSLIYKYLRGSWCHGIAIERKSDYDYGGVFVAPSDQIFGMRSTYQEQIADERSDETYYELGRWFELLLKSNPTALESLFVDPEFVIKETEIITHIKENRDMFLTKECFKPFLGYSFQQIKKAKGYNKKCNYPDDMRRKTILDFCSVPYKQGSVSVEEWLDRYGLKQKYCGLVSIPNMHDMYGLYYDWGSHLENEFYGDKEKFLKEVSCDIPVTDSDITKIRKYRGIIRENGESFEVRTCEVPKDDNPITYMSFNKDGYESHCKDYNEWARWKRERNETRYIDNKGYNFDAKNMCETVRLIHTGIEIAKGEGYNVKRTWDRGMLLDIKSHKWSYEELISYITDKKREFNDAVKNCTLPESVDIEKVNNLLIDIRKKFYL